MYCEDDDVIDSIGGLGGELLSVKKLFKKLAKKKKKEDGEPSFKDWALTESFSEE